MPIEESKWNITLQRGESYTDSWQLEVSTEEGWEPLATTGFSVLHQIRRTDDETGELLLDISGNGYVTINNTGLIEWDIPSSIVNTLPRGAWFHDLALVNAANEADYLVRGRAVVGHRISVA